MKQIIHNRTNSEVCVYKHTEELLRGVFFKTKPQVGDVIMSHTKRESNFLHVYKVEEVLKNRDANIQANCTFDPAGAWFELKIKNITPLASELGINNSVHLLS